VVDLRVATLTGPETMLSEAVVEEFRANLRGELICPGDDGYDEARRIWNAMIDKKPALIARCAGVADVIESVDFARANDLLVAVRGGGHNVAGNALCNDGIVIDLSTMKGIRVDPVLRTARAEAGLTWGEFDHETQAFGLATTGGAISTTGIAGLTLGGGLGWLERKYGLTCDNVLSFDMVTAEGQLVTASDTENSDLFWGLRGGGGNFGIVTSFEYQLHEVGPTLLAGMLLHPLEKAKEVLKFYRSFINAGIPDELIVHCFMLTAPDGNLVIAIALCYNGAIEAGEQVVQPLREFGPPLSDFIGPMPYTAVNSMFDASFPPGNHNYWKSQFLDDLSDESIDTIVDHFDTVSSPLTIVGIELVGGAVARISRDATAFSHRDVTYHFIILSGWSNPDEADQHIRWTREFFQKIQPFSSHGGYVNALGDDEEVGRVQSAYGSSYKRLVSLKDRYDPTNLFRLNQNIPPTV